MAQMSRLLLLCTSILGLVHGLLKPRLAVTSHCFSRVRVTRYSRQWHRHQSIILNMIAREANSNPYYSDLDAYGILDVSRSATKADIKAAYRRSVSKHHPDKFPDDEIKKVEGNLRMEKINRAYFCLGDEDRRRRYDKYGEAGVGTSAASELQLKDRLRGTMTPRPPTERKEEQTQRRGYRTVSDDDGDDGGEIPDIEKFTKGSGQGTTSSRFRDFVSSSDEVRKVAEKYAAGSRESKTKERDSPRRSREDEEVDMYAEIAEFLRRNANKQGSGSGRQASSYDEAVEEMNRRSQYTDTADSPALASLRVKKRQLLATKERQEMLLEADGRDWGEEFREDEIQARLQAIAEIRALSDRIFEIDCEIDQLLYKSQRSSEQGDSGTGQFYEREFYDDFDFSDRRKSGDEGLKRELERLWSTERRRGRGR